MGGAVVASFWASSTIFLPYLSLILSLNDSFIHIFSFFHRLCWLSAFEQCLCTFFSIDHVIKRFLPSTVHVYEINSLEWPLGGRFLRSPIDFAGFFFFYKVALPFTRQKHDSCSELLFACARSPTFCTAKVKARLVLESYLLRLFHTDEILFHKMTSAAFYWQKKKLKPKSLHFSI